MLNALDFGGVSEQESAGPAVPGHELSVEAVLRISLPPQANRKPVTWSEIVKVISVLYQTGNDRINAFVPIDQ